MLNRHGWSMGKFGIRPSIGEVCKPPTPCTIVHLEMINVYIALSLCKHRLSGKAVVIHCDNMAVVCSLNSGRSWDPFLGTVARNIWLVTSTHDIDLAIQHIPNKINVLAELCPGGMGNSYIIVP